MWMLKIVILLNMSLHVTVKQICKNICNFPDLLLAMHFNNLQQLYKIVNIFLVISLTVNIKRLNFPTAGLNVMYGAK